MPVLDAITSKIRSAARALNPFAPADAGPAALTASILADGRLHIDFASGRGVTFMDDDEDIALTRHGDDAEMADFYMAMRRAGVRRPGELRDPRTVTAVIGRLYEVQAWVPRPQPAQAPQPEIG